MRKGTGRKFARERDQRRALKKSLAVGLITRETIKTTLARAKELRPFIECLITKARVGDIAAFRYLLRYLPRAAASKLFKEISPKFKDVSGGYTRIIKAGKRKTDCAPLGIIEFAYKNIDKHESSKETK